MTSQPAPSAQTVATPASTREFRDGAAGPMAALLTLSAWCGLLAGLVEVATIVVRKRFFDANQLLGMSRHFVWLIPLTNALIFVGLGVIGGLLVLVRPAYGRRTVARTLAALTPLPAVLVAFPRIYGLAWLLASVGVASRLVPPLERHALAFGRAVRISSPVLALTLAVLALSPFVGDRIERWRESARPTPAEAPNVLLIVMDTVAADHLGVYGYPRPTSTAIAEIARRGARFASARSASSWTLPSHATMFTGRWPHELSVGWRTPLDATRPTVAGFLASRGYATAGFVANTLYCSRDSGLGRGFAEYHDYLFRELSPFKMAVLVQRSLGGLQTAGDLLGETLDLTWPRLGARRLREWFETDRKDAAAVNREFLDWLSQRPEPGRPYFAFLNYFDAHSPYQLPPGRIHRFGSKPGDERESRLIQDWWPMDKAGLSMQELRYVADAYDDCVASIDEQLGRLFDELERRRSLDRTWVIVVSDHGESFGEHPGIYCHGASLYQTELHVPLVIVPPPTTRLKPIVGETASLRDLAATIADLAGLEAESPFPGESLARFWAESSPAATDRRPSDDRALAEVVPNETLDHGPTPPAGPRWPLAGLTEGDWSYIRREGDVREELFNLRDDAREQRNLAANPDAQPRIQRLRGSLKALTGGPLTPDRFHP